MSHKAAIVVPFLIGYFVMRIVILISCIFDDGTTDFHDNSDYIWSSIVCITFGMVMVFGYLLIKYFGII